MQDLHCVTDYSPVTYFKGKISIACGVSGCLHTTEVCGERNNDHYVNRGQRARIKKAKRNKRIALKTIVSLFGLTDSSWIFDCAHVYLRYNCDWISCRDVLVWNRDVLVWP